ATAARMRTPGAVTSGLSRSKLPAGPRELKAPSASTWLVSTIAGYGMPAVTAGLAAAKSRSASASACSIPNAGIVVPGTDGISAPAALLATTTATAPAAAALSTLMVNEQEPRRTTAMAPAKAPSGSAAQASSTESIRGLTTSGVSPGTAACWLTPLLPGFISMAASASGTGCGPVTSSTTTKSPRPCCDAAVDDTQGSTCPSVFGAGPLLPAEAAM